MKHLIYGTGLLCLAVLVIAGTMIVSGQGVRKNELEKALNTAVEQTLEQLKKEGGYQIENQRELIADFHQALLLNISSDSEVKVDILAADHVRGVLDVRVTETYQTVHGKQKQASCRKTVIVEEYVTEKPYHIITFEADGKIYAKYSLSEAGVILEPEPPRKNGHVFLHWIRSDTGEILDTTMTAKKDLTFAAVFQ